MDLIWKYSYKNHNEKKQILLDVIDKCNSETIDTLQSNGDLISKTDYYQDVSRPYMNILLNDLEDFRQHLLNYHCCSSLKVVGSWFQQYYKNDIHNWHFHASCNLSVVYFLELDSFKDSTEFFDITTRKCFQIEDVKEGDIIVFPPLIPHRSPKNKSEKRKSIISFNLNFGQVNMNLLPGGS